MQKFVLFLAGGRWQLPWFQFLKEKGHKLFLVDPYEDCACRSLADKFFRCDVKNVDSIYRHVQNSGVSIEAITSDQTDVSCLPVAELAKLFRVKGISPEIVKKFSNKYLSREFLLQSGFGHIPKFEKVYASEDVATFISSNNLKFAIVKPVDAQSSRGIFKIDNSTAIDELSTMFNSCLAASSESYAIAEEFMVGKEITVEGISLDGIHYCLTGSSKKHFRTGIASELFYPLDIKTSLQRRIAEFHNQIVEATGLSFGVTHAEYIVDETKEDFWLVEMACRGGGSMIPSTIVPWVTGVNVYELLYKSLFGGSHFGSKIDRYFTHVAYSILHFFEFSPGVVKSINGVEECRSMDSVILLDLEFGPGDLIKPASDDRGRQGFVIIQTTRSDEIRNTLNQIYSKIEITYE